MPTTEQIEYRAYLQSRYAPLWEAFTPAMKDAFRRIAKRGHLRKSNFAPATCAALKRRRVLMESERLHRSKKTYHIQLSLNANGCELYDWLKFARKVTKD